LSRRRKIVIYTASIFVIGFLLLQVFPVGIIRSSFERKPNPEITATVEWNSVEVQNLAKRACYDCHSNETIYPWYAQVAPMSWLVNRDINQGRASMNFSQDAETEYDISDLEWHLYNDMPPDIYLIMHPDAKLTDEERDMLMEGFKATFTKASMDGMDMSGG
jgi:hypothetical protein